MILPYRKARVMRSPCTNAASMTRTLLRFQEFGTFLATASAYVSSDQTQYSSHTIPCVHADRVSELISESAVDANGPSDSEEIYVGTLA
jgi:hypothetical protein